MAGRPVQNKADIKAIQHFYENTNGYSEIVQTTMIKPLIVFTMRNCGCTFREIAEVFNISKQMAETIYKNAKASM